MSKIKSLLIKGAFFTALSKYSVMIVNILVTAVLARLIAPEDFGVIALTVVMTSFFDVLSHAGLGPAIIQNKDIDATDLPHLFRFSFYLAIILVFLFLLLIYPITSFYKEPRLYTVLYIISLQLFFNALNVVPIALLLKEKKFSILAKNSIIASCICGFLSIVAAYNNLGIYSLLITPVGVSIIVFILTIRYNLNIIKFDTLLVRKNSIKKIISFSIYQFMFNCINYFSRNLDKILMGKLLGMQALGYYEKSYRLMTLPISTLTNVFSPSIQPVLSDFQDDIVVIRNVYNKLSFFLFFIGTILAPFLFFSASDIIQIIFGPQWMPAVPIFQSLAISVPFQMVDSFSGCILQSANQVKCLFKSGVYCVLLNFFVLILSLLLFDSIAIIAFFISISFVLNYFISLFYICRYAIHLTIFNYLKSNLKYLFSMILFSILMLLISLVDINFLLSFVLKSFCALIYTLLSAKYFGFFSLVQIKTIFSI